MHEQVVAGVVLLADLLGNTGGHGNGGNTGGADERVDLAVGDNAHDLAQENTAGGVLLGKVMCVVTHGKINPLIGSAGVSAVPMAARVSQKVGQEYNPRNYLLMHAMGPNVAGVIGSAVAAGILINMFG